eukprot:GEMP01005709.1.p1 GENE.GEMP01005709.1~~GEMP01005709.1.p1  ORF type:complete len:1069 (+),score=221.53 GEMP01005709.1:212-3418(+)
MPSKPPRKDYTAVLGQDKDSTGDIELSGFRDSQQRLSAQASTQTVKEALDAYGVNHEHGLRSTQVAENLRKYGRNELDVKEPRSWLKLIAEQFEDLLVRILLLAAAISLILAVTETEPGYTPYVEPLVILLILIANAIVGVWQECNAEDALKALKKLQPLHAYVLRNGDWKKIDAIELVPGDIVELRTGDKIPADGRIVSILTPALGVDQASLTGESETVQKTLEPTNETVIQGRTNMLFSATSVVQGSCRVLITATGMGSEIGKIQACVTGAEDDEAKTPLQEQLDQFGNLLARVIFVICVVVWLINWKHFGDAIHGSWIKGCIYYFKIAISLAVAAIPEGLPAVITTCLALGTRRMAQRNCIVRKLPSVETLGCTSVICTDKTGTLTTNEMCVATLFLPSENGHLNVHNVDGSSYDVVGAITPWVDALIPASQHFLRCAALCNNANLHFNSDKRVECVGEATEGALLTLVEKLGCPHTGTHQRYYQQERTDDEALMACSKYWQQEVTRHATLEFTRDRKSMGVIVCPQKGSNVLLVKGAPESVMARCTHVVMPSDGSAIKLTDELRQEILQQQLVMAERGLRTLAFAHKTSLGPWADYDGPSHPCHHLLQDYNHFATIETELTFVGMCGLRDPPRPEVPAALNACRRAGIAVIMITGDNPTTASTIARDCGLFRRSADEYFNLSGQEFASMDDDEQIDNLGKMLRMKGGIISRAEPMHKLIVVRALRRMGEVVAMTGDGVNDAPGLKHANIGIAMGITGTAVAKDAADMVLADDNFSTIVSAIEEGRSIYSNMKAFIRYLISSNIGEVASIFITSALGIPEIFTPIQLLWVNLVTDGPPATALGFNPPDVDVMEKPPRRSNDRLIGAWIFCRYMIIGTYIGLATVGVFVYWFLYENEAGTVSFYSLARWGDCGLEGFERTCDYFTTGKIKGQTLGLTVLVVIEMLNSLNALSVDGSLMQLPPWVNPWLLLAILASILTHCVILYVPALNPIFHVTPLTTWDWVVVLAFSFPVIILDEILKYCGRHSAWLAHLCRLSNLQRLCPRRVGSKYRQTMISWNEEKIPRTV